MELRFWAATDTGRVRDHNEDNFLVDKRLQLFVVCDGMGGHAAGEVASAVCVRTVREVIAGAGDLLGHLQEAPDDAQVQQATVELLRQAVKSANARIFEMAQQDPSRRGMGTTCSALLISGAHGFVGHVGDSRLYRVREGGVEQITMDHSLLNEMIRQGKLPPDTKERDFPHNNAVTRAVGVREFVEVDAFDFSIEAGDRMMMCSDGLSGYFEEEIDVLDMTSGEVLEDIITRCIDFANESGGKDNITVIVVDAVDAEAEQGDVAPVLEMLRNTPYFHYLAVNELEHIRRLGEVVEVQPEAIVTSPENVTHSLFVILRGSVSLHLDGQRISVLTAGEHFGEMALIDAQDDSDNRLRVQALEPTTLFAIARDDFMGILRSAPGLAIKLLWNFVQVFADRLQGVPAEYRFSPDQWREDPDAAVDFTPPSGSLVFTDDIKRIVERSEAAEVMDDDVEASPVSEHDEETREYDRLPVDDGRLTASLGEWDGSDASWGDEASEDEPTNDAWDDLPPEAVAHRPTVRLSPMRDDESPAGAAFQGASVDGDTTLSPWETPEVQERNASDDWVIGGIDEEGDDALDDDAGVVGSVSFGAPRRGEPEEDLRATIQLDRPLSRAEIEATTGPVLEGNAPEPVQPSWKPGGDDVDAADDLGKTVDIDADLARLRSLRAESALDLKERLRQRMKTRTTPVPGLAAAVEVPASEVPQEAAPQPEPNTSALAGEVEVRSTPSRRKSEPTPEAKVMISPELMGLVDDDES
ncbi:Stp1/IreP family PP2C-type Ser/Thr phosphatase [Bradymonadaceae bacterium TMQ3]|uniref:Stp1/IreP family PP2C-type Ser/Thr phosphatase n=1 Tax=Lujinxingia sediminis TaxID=2480984 RepID=A0ABY0CYG8_9DELT|nr:Stp1/IreP family PP2C-type Ser/Thr phosphatase [Lujinxingia sediminis]RDV39036.1 Stp1/IreP family PP2C-type Ser/Thr phosphatase [Bradymonadaceae bacterium TMQ3]RVU48917.1 Stp1/IreP family PP2C-type Ser/Thr phosphatase [Lujinxingia sediminis]TXC78211.1 Stp1/IreP family PP2C-type Ser/Thr phosphatase [Bradymonadales bacterium TMQ1]